MQVHIVVNAEAIRAMLDEPNQAADQITLVCPNTLERLGLGLRAAPPLMVLDKRRCVDCVYAAEGWLYIRA